MPLDSDIPLLPRRDRLVRFLVVGSILALLLPLTWLGREGYVARLHADGGARQRAAVNDALDAIEAHFETMQTVLVDRAEDMAESSTIVSGLRARARSNLDLGPESLVSYLAEYDVPYGSSVELYDADLDLVAWNGFSMPIDAAPGSPGFMTSFRTGIATDGDLRQALVVWWPVRSGPRAVGVVRTMLLVGYDAPVRNEYIRDVSLVEQWRRLTKLPVTLELDASGGAAEQSRLLQGADGTVLARVAVEPPTVDQLAERASARFDDVMVLWTVLLLFWVVGGVWLSYRRHRQGLSNVTQGRRLWHAIGWFSVVSVVWWLLRFVLLALDVPGRWQRDKAPLAPLFDPIHFASGFGGGLLRSTGDFLLTALFALVFAIAFVELAQQFGRRAAHLYRRRDRIGTRPPGSAIVAVVGAVALGALAVQGLTLILGLAARHVVLDSTFDTFARRGLLPEPLLLVVFCTLLLAAIALILIAVAVVWITASVVLRRSTHDPHTWPFWLAVSLAAAVPLILIYALTPVAAVLSWPVSLSMLVVAFALAVFAMLRDGNVAELFILRSILPSVFLVTMLLYPMLYSGMDANRRIQMMDAAETFAEGRDPRVLFAIEELLRDVQMDDQAAALLRANRASGLDSLAALSFRRSLLASLPAYDVSVTFYDALGRAATRYFDTGQALEASSLAQVAPMQENLLYQMYREAGGETVMVAPVTGLREPDRFQFEGIGPVVDVDADTVGWVTAHAEPQTLLREGGTPFPRVLLPSGSYDDLFANLSIVEFRDGLLVRSMGRDFGRYRLSDDIVQDLASESSLWRAEKVEDRIYQTFYLRRDPQPRTDLSTTILPASTSSIVAVRVPSINTFDHLYYLLRLTVAGLFIGLPLYLFGLYIRRREGVLPAPRVRFRDKVLNAFLCVGIISVAAVGFVGLQVVTEENERAVQSWLRQHLERVEETLALDARGEEMPYSVLDGTRIDSLSARVGLDLNVYSGYALVDLSRPQLIQERLIDERLPIEAFEALYFDGYRFIYTNERVGSFRYTTGFRALPDEQGRPRFVVSVPTLPEQERIEEERARTVAYLFGSLLLLVLVVMLTASLLANAISRPIARLRSGLKAVAAGRFERMLPVDSRDEIGELVQTFNEMQDQLAESRRKLAQQERQLAWREMARQVAHEIKNPLTPMKLSVQHLRRAFEHREEDEAAGKPFTSVFERITSTLIEQIDTLARIANEFHSFARMPSRILEHLDLNAVVDEAVSLMQEEGDVDIRIDLSEEPLVVEADREELRRIYINLIKNAMQAIPDEVEGLVEVRTELRAEDGAAWAFSTVMDNGEGVEDEVRDKIFEPNFSTKTSGTGLGLAIVRKGVEELHGDVGFETTDGKGTTFWLRLPLADE